MGKITHWKWLVPGAFLLLGMFLYRAVHGHGFLGLICFCVAGVIACYYLLNLLQRKYQKAAKVLRTVLTAGLCLGIFTFAVTEALIIKASLGSDDTDCRYIVVLGAKVNGTEPSISLSDRLDAAYDYLTENPGAIAVLSGGQGEDENLTEAECMFRQLTARGIDPQRLWMEEQATSTWENLKFSLNLIEEKTGTRPQKIGLLSSEYHLFRAGLFARDCGVEAVGIPAKTSWLSIRLNYFLREVAGVWHYIILGGQYHD